jgi:hypothetical protein
MAERREGGGQRPGAQARPAQRRLRIARRRRLDERVEIPQQRGGENRGSLAPAARLPHALDG